MNHTHAALIRAIDLPTLKRQEWRSWLTLAIDLGLAACIAALIILVDHWFFGFLLSILLSLVFLGIQVLAHEAGHRAFCKNRMLNDIVGNVLSSITLLIPFHHLRVAHNDHHKYTHLYERDPAFAPYTIEDFQKQPAIVRAVYRFARRYWPGAMLGLFGVLICILGTLGPNPEKFFPNTDRKLIKQSLHWTLFYMATVLPTLVYFTGFYGLFYIVIFPILMNQNNWAILSLATHTSPDNPWHHEKEWDFYTSCVKWTYNVDCPKWFDLITHNALCHIPHHISSSIPFYHLKTAQKRLDAAFPEIEWRTLKLGWKFWWNILEHCHWVEYDDQGQGKWITFAEGEESRKNIRMPEALHFPV